MNYKTLTLLVMKIILDVVSRIMIFSAWMYTDNAGQFSTKRTFLFFYGLFLLNFILNVALCNKKRGFKSIRNLIGKKPFFNIM